MTPAEEIDAAIKAFKSPQWSDDMELREWESARADQYSTALFTLLGSLESLIDRDTVNAATVAGAISRSLGRG